MSSSMLLGLFSWIGDFFKALFDLIPKIIYLLYASFACLIDVMQLFFRKLAGLDVYYVKGEAVTGDLVTNFITSIIGINKNGIKYPTLTTVFYSFILFGVIICFFATLIAIIKSHYTYDEKAAKGPMQYVYTAGKAIINMLAVPVIVVLGLYVSEALLEALDSITSTTSDSLVQLYGKDALDANVVQVDTVKGATGTATGEKTYIFYDIFGFAGSISYGSNDVLNGANKILGTDFKELKFVGAKSATFSGTLFKVAAYNGNRARLGQMGYRDWIDVSDTSTIEQFSGSKSDVVGNTLFKNAKSQDQLAEMIDTAFACNLHMNGLYKVNYLYAGSFGGIVSFKYFTNFLCQAYHGYSKFNVGLVWYYYDLWQFNFLVGFAGCITCVSIFVNIILGLITRLFMCIVLFLVAPPLFGLAPLDGGGAAKKWRENFMKQVLMTYGAVVGMNLMMMILPYFNDIDFFNIGIADLVAQSLIIIVGLITIKAVIATLSEVIGAADANKTGEGISKEVGETIGKAGKMTMMGAKAGAKAWNATVGQTALGQKVKAGAQKIGAGAKGLLDKGQGMLKRVLSPEAAAQAAGEKLENFTSANAQHEALDMLEGMDAATYNATGRAALMAQAQAAGLSGDALNNLMATADAQAEGVAGGGTMSSRTAKKELMKTDKNFQGFVKQIGKAAGTDGLDNNAQNQAAFTAIKSNLETRKKTLDTRVQNGSPDLYKGLGSMFEVAPGMMKTGTKGSIFDVIGKTYTEKEKQEKQRAIAQAESTQLTAKITQWTAMHPGETLTEDVLAQLKKEIAEGK